MGISMGFNDNIVSSCLNLNDKAQLLKATTLGLQAIIAPSNTMLFHCHMHLD